MTTEGRQTRLLARTFFSRLFETDMMAGSQGQVQLVISVIAFLAAPALILPVYTAKKYLRIRDPDLLAAAMAQDRTMALLLAMVATAMITLVIWENIFPDRRDSRTSSAHEACKCYRDGGQESAPPATRIALPAG